MIEKNNNWITLKKIPGYEKTMIKSVTILFVVAFIAMLVCVIPVAAQENSLNIQLKGSPETVSPGELITYDIWYDAQVYGDWFADHLWVFFQFDPCIEIISAPWGCISGSGDFTPGMTGNGWLSELIGGTFIGKIKPDSIPGSIISTTVKIWDCLELSTDNEVNYDILSASGTSLKIVEDPVSVPEFPNMVPVILSSVGMLAVVLFIKKK